MADQKPALATPAKPAAQPAPPAESRIVEATGTATATSSFGKKMEEAMVQVVLDLQKESEAIAADKNLSDDARLKKLAEINNPDEIKRRKDAARKKLRAERSEREMAASRKVEEMKPQA